MEDKVLELTSANCEYELKVEFSKGNMLIFIRDMNLILSPKDNYYHIFIIVNHMQLNVPQKI